MLFTEQMRDRSIIKNCLPADGDRYRDPQPNLRQSSGSVWKSWIELSEPEGARMPQEDKKVRSTNLGLWELTETGPPTKEHAWTQPRPPWSRSTA